MPNTYLNVAEVAVLTGKSIQTINLWYKWKKDNPEHELAKLLPDYIQESERQKRKWRREDVWKIIEFDKSIKKGGRNGLFAKYTYHPKPKEEK